MRRIALSMVLGLITACGGAADEQPPVQPPPPPPAPTAPAPVDTAPVATAAPAPPPKPALADLEAAAVADLATNFTDASKVAAHYAPDATMFIPGMPPSTGREAIQKSLQDFLDQNTGVATANARTWTKGNQVAVHWVSTATDKATGKPWGIDGLSVYTFNDDGLITKDDTYFDVVTMMKQTGAYKDERPARAPSTLPTGAVEAHAAKNDATEDANVAKDKALNAAFLQGDAKTVMPMFADDYVGNAYALWEPKGKKWVEENVTLSAKTSKDRSRKDLAAFGVEDFTIAEGENTYTQAADYNHGKIHVPNKHKTVTTHGVIIHQWKDGKNRQGLAVGQRDGDRPAAWNRSRGTQAGGQASGGEEGCRGGAQDQVATRRHELRHAPGRRAWMRGAGRFAFVRSASRALPREPHTRGCCLSSRGGEDGRRRRRGGAVVGARGRGERPRDEVRP